MKYCAIIVLLLLSGDALGECSHRLVGSLWEEGCDCSHRPYELIWAEKYRDGGTIEITVADSVGCAIGVSLDGRLGSPDRGGIRFMALPWDIEGVGLADAVEEDWVLRLLSNVADRYMSRAEQSERLEGRCPEWLSEENCRYSGWLLELLRAKGRR